ncbi:STAS domain-containing protein [Solirubrobacter deserti]|uniref:STAS domain-containing protein n=1 Tax=Solirubrobacter deserti TaxID=2282478 RepID=A0ABT4RRT4_9ACTN|nr:STAS domain-containing protein [Solirubrobacter deserti]MDA0141170.1 STAS domain-containing protein [Solirubrobacter deserti]
MTGTAVPARNVVLSFKVERQQSNGKLRIVIRGELDMETGPRAEEELRRAEEDKPQVLVLDLREVSFFDSTGLQLVLDADVRAREEGRTFIVIPGDGEPRRVLELAEVTDRLNLEE